MTFLFATGYSAFQTVISINAKGNIKEKSRVIRSWSSDSFDDFHNPQYRENIVSITFLNTREIPNNVEESWDVSSDGKGGVIAYVKLNEEDHTKYDLFIGAKDGVIANEISSWLFYDMKSLKQIDFNNNFDTSNAITMESMFRACTSIKTIDISSFDTNNVTNMYGMFCFFRNEIMLSNSLREIKFGNNFNTSNVKNMGSMFAGAGNLITLDLSNFNTSNVTTTFHMFLNCQSLKTIYVSDKFTMTNVSDSPDMFINDTNLVGGNGTTYDSNHIDKEYARIDTPSTSGYFTLKQ